MTEHIPTDGLPPHDRRAYLHQELDRVLDMQEDTRISDLGERGHYDGWAGALVGNAAGFARLVLGSELLREALEDIDVSSRTDSLQVLERQLNLASELFGRSIPLESPGSLYAAVEELRAIQSGDEPKLFAKLEGRKIPYRVAKAKLEAIGWDSYLEALGEPAYMRHAQIGAAFGHDWDTIYRWRTGVASHLGEKHVASVIRQRALVAKHGFPLLRSLTEDGLRYKLAMGYRVTPSDESD